MASHATSVCLSTGINRKLFAKDNQTNNNSTWIRRCDEEDRKRKIHELCYKEVGEDGWRTICWLMEDAKVFAGILWVLPFQQFYLLTEHNWILFWWPFWLVKSVLETFGLVKWHLSALKTEEKVYQNLSNERLRLPKLFGSNNNGT